MIVLLHDSFCALNFKLFLYVFYIKNKHHKNKILGRQILCDVEHLFFFKDPTCSF